MEKGKRANVLGPTGRRVAENVRQLRERAKLTMTELSQRLEELGRVIPPLSIRRIEDGAQDEDQLDRKPRRVDADDLVALALALDVTPNRLLLPETAPAAPQPGYPPPAGGYRAALLKDYETVGLTESKWVQPSHAWSWACGDMPLKVEDVFGRSIAEFQAVNRPHNPLAYALSDELIEHGPAIRDGVAALMSTGLPLGKILPVIQLLYTRFAQRPTRDELGRMLDHAAAFRKQIEEGIDV